MKQITYAVNSKAELLDAVAEVKKMPACTVASSVLACAYLASPNTSLISELASALQKQIPGAQLAGLTTDLGIASENVGTWALTLSFTLFERSQARVIALDAVKDGLSQAADMLSGAMRETRGLKAVQFFADAMGLGGADAFFEDIVFPCPDIACSGACAAPLNVQELSSSSFVFAGERIMNGGITAVLFSGEDLHAQAAYNLGWTPAGREMEITRMDGPVCIAEFDGKPAVEAYRNYLGVEPDEAFVANIMEFPLVLNRDGQCIARGVVGTTDEGGVILANNLSVGEKTTLSIANVQELLEGSAASAQKLAAFAPQALFLTVCENRQNYLGSEQREEVEFYHNAAPALAGCCAYGEVARIGEHAQSLNCALVALALREGACPPASEASNMSKQEQRPKTIPLLDRLITFTRATSKENAELRERTLILEHENVLAKERAANAEHLRHVGAEMLYAMAEVIDAKDAYTNGHSKRVAAYSREIARRAGKGEEYQERIYRLGLLHDMGKVGIPDDVLKKPGRLTDEEFHTIQSHTVIGDRILSHIKEDFDFCTGARSHHERWDGKGYPDGLAGESIPEEARIIAVADAYDAMTSRRVYRDIMPQERVRGQIESGAGTQFDPAFARIMLDMIDEDNGYKMTGCQQSNSQ